MTANTAAIPAPQKPALDELAKAVMLDDAPEVEALVRRGADFNEQNRTGWNMLTLAANHGRIASARALIDNGADVNKQGKHGVTPLMRAVHMGHAEMILLLIDKGADPDICDNNGYTAQRFAESMDNTAMTQVLEQAIGQRHHGVVAERQQRLNSRTLKPVIIRGPKL